MSDDRAKYLVLLFLAVIAHNVEELQAVLALARADHPEPIAQLLLLKELLRQVLEVPTAEVLVGYDLDAAVAQVGDGDGVAEVAGAAIDLDALLQEGGEGGGVEDAVVGGLLGVDDVLRDRLSRLIYEGSCVLPLPSSLSSGPS